MKIGLFSSPFDIGVKCFYIWLHFNLHDFYDFHNNLNFMNSKWQFFKNIIFLAKRRKRFWIFGIDWRQRFDRCIQLRKWCWCRQWVNCWSRLRCHRFWRYYSYVHARVQVYSCIEFILSCKRRKNCSTEKSMGWRRMARWLVRRMDQRK